MYIAGQQVCRGCGEVQFCVWPVTGESTDAECGCCGAMQAQFAVAFPLAEFPSLRGLVEFSDAKRRLLGASAVRRDS